MKIADKEVRKLILEEIYRLRIESPTGEITEQLFDPKEKSQEYKTSLAISAFQRLYRSLDVDTKHFFIEWLRSAIIKNLSVDEAIALTSKITSASKAMSQPKNPNPKK